MNIFKKKAKDNAEENMAYLPLKITGIRWQFFATDPKDNVLAMASIIIHDQLIIHEVRVIRGKERVFVAYPNKQYNVRDRKGSVYPIDDFLRREWEHQILADYRANTFHTF